MSESEILSQSQQILEHSGAVVFRNNVGCARFGKRWVRYGVGGPGGSDLIGFVPVRVTPKMVGKIIAVFMAVETKDLKGKSEQEQRNFVANVQAHGGISGFARCWQDAIGIVKIWLSRFE